MKIDEAIKALETEILFCNGKDFVDAIKLGIEALKALEGYRLRGIINYDVLLVGETEE